MFFIIKYNNVVEFKCTISEDMKDLKVLKDSLNYKEMISELLSGNYKQITKIGEKKIKINKDITYTEDILEENNISIKSLVELKDFIGNDFDCELIEE